MRRESAFTLIELIVTLGIIGLLASLLLGAGELARVRSPLRMRE